MKVNSSEIQLKMKSNQSLKNWDNRDRTVSLTLGPDPTDTRCFFGRQKIYWAPFCGVWNELTWPMAHHSFTRLVM